MGIPIQAILFDFDGVLTTEAEGSPSIIHHIAESMKLSEEAVQDAYYRFNGRLLNGSLRHEDMWGEFCKILHCDIPYQILTDALTQIHLDRKMVSIIHQIRTKYKTGMITDNKTDRIEAILQQYDLTDLFDIVVISANVKCRKNESAIFQYAMNELGLSGRECVFVDNNRDNLKAPAELGMQTIFFDDKIRPYDRLEEYFK